MSVKFVPLVARKSPSTAGAASGGGPSPAFTPLRPQADPVAGGNGMGHGHGSESGGGKVREPVVTLTKDGDKVTGIRIECGCGQVIELACAY